MLQKAIDTASGAVTSGAIRTADGMVMKKVIVSTSSLHIIYYIKSPKDVIRMNYISVGLSIRRSQHT